ncbi:hypothetical protein BGAL_0018g00470 [Botrytis galanthina]|uniref:Single-strand DNA deaminase toxin A-like C-terminal domain-containing protein n=1 Tax=Botrytis galanthina TaxID=278940 RepID=A0A4S8RBX6_9HELO|nr:hypothetical protein BGAL_0018g00470 [Botrytis galanthina]
MKLPDNLPYREIKASAPRGALIVAPKKEKTTLLYTNRKAKSSGQIEMMETSRSQEFRGRRPCELRRELIALKLNPYKADGTPVEDEPVTQSHENKGFKSANGSENMTNDHDDLADKVANLKLGPKKRTAEETWHELTDNANPKLASYRSLDITPDPSWLESILSKVNSILEKTTDGGQLKGGDKDSAIERRNDVLRMLMQGALELGSHILDSPEIARKLAAQHGIQNEDLRNAVTSVGTGTDNSTDENIIIASTRCENCSGALAPYQEVEVTEKPTQESRDRTIWFEYHSKTPESLYYTIDLYEQVHTFNLKKLDANSNEKTVARLYVPIKSPPPRRRTPNFDASKAQVINAVSGWVPLLPANGYPNPFIQNGVWTEEVHQMCQTIGYELPESQFDQGIPAPPLWFKLAKFRPVGALG